MLHQHIYTNAYIYIMYSNIIFKKLYTVYL